MISTIPPPRPVSVNSLARSSVSTPIPYTKSNRSTSAEFAVHDDPVSAPVVAGLPPFQAPVEPMVVSYPSPSTRPELRFENLPIEIHEAILDYLFGERASAFTTTGPGKSSARNYNKSLRHPRRKALSNLSLISPVWRSLVQDRIYRHLKIKGTTDQLEACAEWLHTHPHLTPYVRQVEVWIPVWGKRVTKVTAHRHAPVRRFNEEDAGLTDVGALQTTMAWDDSDPIHANDYKYYYASHNATLQEIFLHVQTCFPEARILTLEGGHCKKPPMIHHFRNDPCGHSGQRLPVLPDIQTFVMRGAWNIMRDYTHWRTLSNALPNVREWHCAYAKPKIEGYDTVAEILRQLPSSLVHVNLSLEGFYSKDSSQASWFNDGTPTPHHLCRLLGEVAPRLESLTFTGKVCACLFSATRAFMNRNAIIKSRLKSLDIAVKTCCREKHPVPSSSGLPPFLDDFSGITNLTFIRSFEKLVLGAVDALTIHSVLSYMRIRFIDLDSACPLLNPYFQLQNDECIGLWSEHILETLNEARPQAQFVELSDGIYPQYGPNHQIIGAVYPRSRPLSIHASTYRIIADVSKSI
ncbi:hypothetical protein FE257_000110 [Aspergillus nanangensis]|uniref:Uncharacterized protein n=1 Tax=Aspergillus nanangensis TaxID=2582783 RepID=A0AAD4CZ92_ASPNN|nr:hypothetical protein FE257_000110 [Aspergillus nanangensis]